MYTRSYEDFYHPEKGSKTKRQDRARVASTQKSALQGRRVIKTPRNDPYLFLAEKTLKTAASRQTYLELRTHERPEAAQNRLVWRFFRRVFRCFLRR